MSIDLAIADIVTTLESIVSVTEENQEPGNLDYHLAVTIGNQEIEYYFGAKRIKQEISLLLSASGTVTNKAIALQCKAISDALVLDRRRGGNAQTTIAGRWEKNEDEGREGRVFESTIEVHVYES